MKQLILFFLVFSINKGCSQSVEEDQALTLVTYSAMTRGSSYRCDIDKENIGVTSNGTAAENKTRNITPEEWEIIRELVDSIPLSTIQNFEAPTNNSAFDGVRMANIVIEANGEIYESETFDEGNPPKELKALVDLILSLAETVE